MSNQVAHRIYDFLKGIPPFSFVDDKDALLRVAGRVEVLYQPIGTVIFNPGEPPNDRFYIVREGAVELFSTAGEEKLVERCGEGEAFGIRPVLAEDDYIFRARAAEETLLYAINTEGFRDLLPNYPELTRYLATSMAGSSRYNIEYRAAQRNDTKGAATVLDLHELQSVNQARDPVTCLADSRIVAAAKIMTSENVGSIIIVDQKQFPVGIITDRDLRSKIATGAVSNQALVGEIMQGPVICIGQDSSVADAQIEMVRYGINHLVLTEDGTDKSALTGVISKHDLLVLQGNNPAVLVRAIERAKDAGYLRELRERAERLLQTYLEREVSILLYMSQSSRGMAL